MKSEHEKYEEFFRRQNMNKYLFWIKYGFDLLGNVAVFTFVGFLMSLIMFGIFAGTTQAIIEFLTGEDFLTDKFQEVMCESLKK